MAKAKSAKAPRNSRHAVSVIADATACPAAQQLRGVRHLPAAAPRLPLTDCDRQNLCRCRFEHHADRRSAQRRAASPAAPAAAPAAAPGAAPDKDRRRPGERRERTG